MTNEERIYKLCEYVMDLIFEIKDDTDYGSKFDWINDELRSIQKDIDGSDE